MARMYSAVFENIAQAASGDLIQVTPGSGLTVVLHSIFYGQDDDAGVDNADIGRIEICKAIINGSGGTTVNAEALDDGDQADACTVVRHRTTPAASTTSLIIETFNWQAGWVYRPLPRERIQVRGTSAHLVIRLRDTPATSHQTSMTLIFEEIG